MYNVNIKTWHLNTSYCMKQAHSRSSITPAACFRVCRRSLGVSLNTVCWASPRFLTQQVLLLLLVRARHAESRCVPRHKYIIIIHPRGIAFIKWCKYNTYNTHILLHTLIWLKGIHFKIFNMYLNTYKIFIKILVDDSAGRWWSMVRASTHHQSVVGSIPG